ncbi:glycosyltransferase [Spirosoma agri]|uniref:Glycosyltransferase n=1 Tax=Spirosoma agri TaxID=1987381 RepID=A0A6M0IMQ2_9BACT|nr:glycosyltransferase [Spirosoma agri]NEU69596.1 glycosyltransferase [Spirosoma agri]
MTILQTADWFYPSQMGGPSNAIYWQAKAMTRAGHRMITVATSRDLPAAVSLDQWIDMDCGRVIYTKNPHFYVPVNHIWYALSVMRLADVVHINSLFYPSSIVLVAAAKLMGKPLVWSPHGELSPSALVYRPRLKKVLLRLFRMVSNGLVFHATSAAETDYIRQQFGAKVVVHAIPNRMEIPPVAQRNANKYLLFIGRLHPIKAIDQLIEALSESTVFRESDYTLTIAGPGSNNYLSYLHERTTVLNLSRKVNFVGTIQGDQKEQLYADAYLTILPSHAENFGNVVIESLAQGTPVVASTGTPWQLLESERAGHWVANKPAELRRIIDLYLQMPAEAYQLYRQRAARLARRTFDVHANVGQWEQLYRDAAQRTLSRRLL